MASTFFDPPPPRLLRRQDFPHLIQILQTLGYQILGPVVSNGAAQWDEITRVEDLPIGWKDHQTPGNYCLHPDSSGWYFNIVHGPQSLKPLVFAPREHLLILNSNGKTFSAKEILPDIHKTAVLGIRGCDLAGLGIQDQIFLEGPYSDAYYQRRRENLFLIAANCTRAHETCFCASMKTGPKATAGYDLRLTEADDDFTIETGSAIGSTVLEQLPTSPASADRIHQDEERITLCAASQTRTIPHSSLPQGLYDAHDHARWDDVAARCLACTNCTMVCPTCFCHGVEETPSLDFQQSDHTRVWESCFETDHGFIHGKNFRPAIKDRYRMWLTHKLGSWIDQFGMSGCIGCGRCITWCPVGIDLTEEVQALCLPTK